MTNIDRAAELLWLPEPHLFVSECDDQARELAQALADAGLLTPELPASDRRGLWWPKHGRAYEHVRTGTLHSDNDRVVISFGNPHHISQYLTREEALELASILTAAANYAERNQE